MEDCNYLNDDRCIPVYMKGHQTFSLEALSEILLTNLVPPEKLCSKTPFQVEKNMSFVVDMHKLDNPADIRADENGIWIRKGSPVAFISLHQKPGKKACIYRRSSLGNHKHHFKVTRSYWQHSCSPDFKRMIVTAHGILTVHITE